MGRVNEILKVYGPEPETAKYGETLVADCGSYKRSASFPILKQISEFGPVVGIAQMLTGP
jgi:hypothetical protein